MRTLVTGGLGLVGCSYAAHRLRLGDSVVVLDNGARGISNQLNLEWLRTIEADSPGKLVVVDGGVETWTGVLQALGTFGGIDAVIHAAAQSSVDVSMEKPLLDFEWNVQGTVFLLEALRVQCPKARMVFLASNKVYRVSDWPVELVQKRYRWLGKRVGPEEKFPFSLDAEEPYGASKIAGLFYARCYASLYNMPIAVCIPSGMFGPRQFGKTEQGWLGWMAIATELGLPIEIRGDGFQARDMCYIDDVCSALDLLLELAERYPGEMWNLGGGPRNAISLMEAVKLIEENLGKKATVTYADWRRADNRCYVSNIEKLISCGWVPSVGVEEGIRRVCEWVRISRSDLEKVYLAVSETV